MAHQQAKSQPVPLGREVGDTDDLLGLGPCPLTKNIMVDPVIGDDGLTYERWVRSPLWGVFLG